MTDPEVLVVGAGPTGLVLAFWLTRLGVRVRVIDKAAGPGTASRAIVVQARTLELYRQVGLADEVVREGIRMDNVRLRVRGKTVATLQFGDIGGGLSPYPFALSYPQDDHEKLLARHLTAAGVGVEWNTELTGFREEGQRVRAVLRTAGGEQVVSAAYLGGCDGAHSAVRHGLGVGFPGGSYPQAFFVADTEATGVTVNGDLNACLGPDLLMLVFPVRSSGSVRLIGLLPPGWGDRPDVTFDDLRPVVEKHTGVRVSAVNWFSVYHIHHRVAERFRVGRAFLAGDAGHIHSPAGAQGMNTGIGDAINLAWKLAAVLRGRGTPTVLDTYEPERIAFARSLVGTTDRVFRLMVGTEFRSRLLRGLILPFLAPLALSVRAARRAAFRLISQVRIRYPDSKLSRGATGKLHGGDRLPWVQHPTGDNFAPLTSVDWQVHVYGTATPELRTATSAGGIPLHEFPWTDAAQKAGFRRDALYLVRPDGYLAFVSATQDVNGLTAYLTEFAIRPRG